MKKVIYWNLSIILAIGMVASFTTFLEGKPKQVRLEKALRWLKKAKGQSGRSSKIRSLRRAKALLRGVRGNKGGHDKAAIRKINSAISKLKKKKTSAANNLISSAIYHVRQAIRVGENLGKEGAGY